jgi:hypothetical protein
MYINAASVYINASMYIMQIRLSNSSVALQCDIPTDILTSPSLNRSLHAPSTSSSLSCCTVMRRLLLRSSGPRFRYIRR